MPLFEYRCSDCGAEFEALVSRGDTEPVECEKCHGKHTERIASTFSCCSSDSTSASAPMGC
ncbi:zinc ribbon domain-containing protein [bacterium]|nr:zinc ribbon domain-containing protein [bacterium]